MKFKQGVDIRGIQPETIQGMLLCKAVFCELNQLFTVTSVCDGLHKEGSLHYQGYAFDLRIWDLRGISSIEMGMHLKEALGAQFQVVVEPSHIHVEFDP